jgi:tRNA(Met) cytidine acetyltransferase
MPPTTFPRLSALAASLARAGRWAGHRRALVLAGTADWGRGCACKILAHLGVSTPLWLADTTGTANLARKWLGREVDVLVIDAHNGLDPDALGAAAGSLRAGGLLLVLCPPLADWPQQPDPQLVRISVYPWRPEQLSNRFIRRLARLLQRSPDAMLVEQSRPIPPDVDTASASALSPQSPTDRLWRTQDQRRAIEAVLRVARGHRRRPLVVTSDRGRGKSAAFGIAAAQLLMEGCKPVLVTGPRLDAVQPLFRHAAALLPDASVGSGWIEWRGRRIEFHAPDALAQARTETRLLLVDEAAALPLPLLERLLSHYARIAFATTVHGYEGSGRGFSLKFPGVLDRRAPGWHALSLREPIRWAEDDPVERLVSRALLLDADISAGAGFGDTSPRACRIERIDRDALVDDESFLSELFGLLILAHYRTRPFDLRQLLDGPNLSVLTLRHRERLLGVALLAREGGLGPELAEGIWSGRRRVRGHLIPQSLAAHLGLREGVGLVGERVMRVAIHPQAQGRGLGTRLMEAVTEQARRSGADWLGASFGATPELLGFWRHSGLEPVRAGVTHEASSGAHSVLVLRGLTERGCHLQQAARKRFLDQLPHQLSGPLGELDPLLAAGLMRREDWDPAFAGPDDQDWLDLVAFVFGGRSYEDSHPAIWKLTRLGLSNSRANAVSCAQQAALLAAVVLMKHPWERLAQTFELTGRRACLKALRQALRPLVEAHAPAPVRALRDQLGDPDQEAKRTRTIPR